MILYDRAPRFGMSLTPLDEADGHPGEAEQPAGEDGTEAGVVGRLANRARGALGRLVRALGRPFQSGGPVVAPPPARSRPLDGREERRDALAATPVERPSRHAERTGGERSATSTDAVTPVEADAGPPEDRPELVASWDDEGLTLAEPGDPEARLSSDTWTEMER